MKTFLNLMQPIKLFLVFALFNFKAFIDFKSTLNLNFKILGILSTKLHDMYSVVLSLSMLTF